MIARWAFHLVNLLLINLVIDVGHTPVQFILKTKQQQQIVQVNDIESLYEWALEELMDKENAVPEQDDASDEDDLVRKSEFWLFHEPSYSTQVTFKATRAFESPYTSSLILRPIDILVPPPKA